ncbi:MAG: AGE family epimerase/isomerase, partial [Propionibacteriaceae bacterium]|nr:AGE family epimerase/isomerase [Propionibacteriaceae bacterium]
MRKQACHLVEFALRSVCDEGGFGYLDERGQVDRSRGRELWINARMTHCAAIGAMLGHVGACSALKHGVRALSELFVDQAAGGWYTAIGWDGQPTDDTKAAYAHAFVILAASSAVATGGIGDEANALLRTALDISTKYFWDETAGMVVEEWDRGFTTLSDYRGINANMHTVEAYLAAADALAAQDPSSLEPVTLRLRALRILDRVINRDARANNWR